MGADIRLVKLCRKAINNEEGGDDNLQVIKAAATDYFDVIEVRSFTSIDSLTDIMGIGGNYMLNQDDVSMQSYPLFCSKEIIRAYSGYKGYGDPFTESREDKLPFLSIIQVHITPEVTARARLHVADANKYLEMFSKDIHEIVDEFVKENKYRMKYRVYQSLSAGDFAVIIRSEEAETSFRISTLMRRRVAQNANASEVKLVLYKTYTILSISNTVIDVDRGSKEERREDNKGVFVIRCCFSNKYWSEKDSIDKTLDNYPAAFQDKIYNLNGRYDFSVNLDEHDFLKIYPMIAKYKAGFLKDEASDGIIEGTGVRDRDFTLTDYLIYLIANGYLSYVNERYLFQTDGKGILSKDISPNVIVDSLSGNDEFLNVYNKAMYKKLLEKYERLERDVREMEGFRKNLDYHMSLIHKLIVLCQTINGLSDTRIYAAILLRQLNTVLENLDIYVRMVDRYQDVAILGRIEGNLRESICALDSFAKYIRNNNLQSLQTPNYSLESNASMEKFLIGYSEFLDQMFRWYGDSRLSTNIDGMQQEFLPVLIPELSSSTLSISVMFPKWEFPDSNPAARLMIVKCSTLRELTNVPEMIAALFHEIAHQFRYEKRSERNNMLLRYSVHLAFEPVINAMGADFKNEIPGVMECLDILGLLEDTFVQLYIEKKYGSNKPEEMKYNFQEYPLSLFLPVIINDISNFWNAEDFWERIGNYKRAYIEEIRYHLKLEDNVMEQLKVLHGIEDKLAQAEDIEACINNSVYAACYLWMTAFFQEEFECEKRIYEDKKKLVGLEEVSDCNWIQGLCRQYSTKREAEFYRLCQLNNNLLDIKESRSLTDIQELVNHRTVSNEFYSGLYKSLCIKWRDKEVCREKYGIRIGRYLGVSFATEDNSKTFIKYLKSRMLGRDIQAPTLIEDSVMLYRELTSDMFMCKMLDLTPFGYLNFMTYNIPIDSTVDSIYFKRFSNVMYSIWCVDDENNSGTCIFKGILTDIKICIKETIAHFEKQLGKSDQLTELKALLRQGGEISNTENERLKLADDCKDIADSCENLLRRVRIRNFPEMDRFESEMRHYGIVCKVLRGTIRMFATHIKVLENYLFLHEDLRRGAERLEELRIDFKNSPLWKYCQKASELLNSPSLVYKAAEIQDINETMVEFIQDMYYSNKIKSGENIIKEVR